MEDAPAGSAENSRPLPEGPVDDDVRRYSHYLLQLRDDLDRLETVPNGSIPAGLSVVGGAVLITILVLAAAPVWLIGSFSALTLAPLLYLFGPARTRAAERRALLSRIRQIEGRRDRIGSAQAPRPGPEEPSLDEPGPGYRAMDARHS